MAEPTARRAPLRSAILFSGLFLAVLTAMPLARPAMHALFPELRQPIYARASFLALAAAHLELVAAALSVAALIGIGVGIAVTRERGRAFEPLARTVGAVGQTFPPVAVLALAVPLLGYGAAPTLAALVVYATLPVLEATLAGLAAVPADARQAARGLGFPAWMMLARVELPLAASLILTGLRNAVIINIGTATIGSSVGALSLGSPILEGLSASNSAYVVEGAIGVALMAIAVDRWFDVAEAALAAPR